MIVGSELVQDGIAIRNAFVDAPEYRNLQFRVRREKKAAKGSFALSNVFFETASGTVSKPRLLPYPR